jgi:hypothetical protein
VRTLTFAVALLSGGGAVMPLDHIALQEALTIANTSIESTHRRFHSDYHLRVNQAPVDFFSIVTPFRRVVLSAESAMRQGRRMFGQKESLAALQPDPDRFEVFAELTFHPHNTLIGVPDLTIELEPMSFRGPTVIPEAIDRLSRFGPRIETPWYPMPYPYIGGTALPGSGPLVGGTLVARFAGANLNPKGVYMIVVQERGRPLASARIDLARVR